MCFTQALCTCIIYIQLKNSCEDQVVSKFTQIHKICKGYPERARAREREREREREKIEIYMHYILYMHSVPVYQSTDIQLNNSIGSEFAYAFLCKVLSM